MREVEMNERPVLIIDSREVGKWWQHMKQSPFDHLKTMSERDAEYERMDGIARQARALERVLSRDELPPIATIFDRDKEKI
jgi:hypothetical protein